MDRRASPAIRARASAFSAAASSGPTAPPALAQHAVRLVERALHSGMWHSDVWKTTASYASQGRSSARRRRPSNTIGSPITSSLRPLDEDAATGPYLSRGRRPGSASLRLIAPVPQPTSNTPAPSGQLQPVCVLAEHLALRRDRRAQLERPPRSAPASRRRPRRSSRRRPHRAPPGVADTSPPPASATVRQEQVRVAELVPAVAAATAAA